MDWSFLKGEVNRLLIYLKTNLFESPAQVLVNTVNTVGVMGKGIALEFKKLYPKMFTEYQRLCENGQFNVGQLWIYRTDNKWVLIFPTKKNWRNRSKLAYIEAGLKKFVDTYEERKIKSISFPQLGVGNGGLDWEKEVRPLMEHYLKGLPINVYIHLYSQPVDQPEFKNLSAMKKWLESEPKMLSVNEFKDELVGRLSHEFQLDNHQIVLQNIEPTDELDESSVPFMRITNADESYYALSQMDITDFWIKLRSQGVVSVIDFPQVLHEQNDATLFQKLMTQLPYIKSVPAKWNDREIGALALNESKLPVRVKPAQTSAAQMIAERG